MLHVQENCVSKYESTDVWSEFGEIIGDLPNDPGLENGVETISTDDIIIGSRFIYDLHGKKVCNSMEEITKLNPGIYIINGRKVFIGNNRNF